MTVTYGAQRRREKRLERIARRIAVLAVLVAGWLLLLHYRGWFTDGQPLFFERISR